ncbi:MAG: DUF3494 domain-containing protein [Solirubrobacterales bacterium]|nr:DUF3494 domain-containing protein [Solirubrobacterales bacterium]
MFLHRLHRLRRPGARPALASIALALTLMLTLAGSALAGPSPVLLRTAGDFAVLAGSGMTNTGTSTIVGDVGSSPTSSQTGFGPCPAVNCVNLTGTNHDDPDPNDAVTQQAKTDLTTAYDDAFGRTGGTAVTAPLGGGMTLVSGVYTSATDIFVGGDLTLDAGGDPDAVFIFQAKTGTLITAAGIANGVPNTRVLLRNGAQACNVFWQVGSSATIQTFTQFVGNILANESITVNTGATLETGSALARNGAVTLDTNTITRATCATPAGSGTTTQPADGGTTPPPPGGATTTPAASTLSPMRPTSRPLPGTARLTGPSGPVSGPFTVSVTGRKIKRVVFYIDGRRVGTVHAKRGRTKFKLKIDPRRQSRRVHRVTVRVTFTPSSRTGQTTRRLTYWRPVLGPRPPRFTG